MVRRTVHYHAAVYKQRMEGTYVRLSLLAVRREQGLLLVRLHGDEIGLWGSWSAKYMKKGVALFWDETNCTAALL
jgi:hypothetical protein